MSPARHFAQRRGLARLLAASAAAKLLPGCRAEAEPMRIGAQVFPGYELLFLARELRRLDSRRVRLIEMPSASASLRALASGAIEAACLTLDEVLMARSRNVPLTVVLVFNVSMGADMLLARPALRSLAELRGRRIGVEQTGVGAVMLDAALRSAGLRRGDVQVVDLAADEHERAYREGQVDAVVTYAPMRQRLTEDGAQPLFSSREQPGLVLDVLAVRSGLLQAHHGGVAAAVNAHLALRDEFGLDPKPFLPQLAPRLGLPPDAVPAAFRDLDLPDRAGNRRWLGTPEGLQASAERLHAVMLRSDLVQGVFEPAGLSDERFVGVG